MRILAAAALAAAIALAAPSGASIAGAEQGIEVSLPPPDFAVEKRRFDPDRPGRAHRGMYEGPIVDTHVHFLRGLGDGGVNHVLEMAERVGVERIIVLPTPNEGVFRHRDENARARRDFVRIAGRRGGRLCGSTYLTRWMQGAYRNGYAPEELAARLGQLGRDLEGGGCLGIGEIGPYHFEKKPGQAVIEFPLDFAPMLALAALAAEKDVRLDLHAEPVTPDGKSYEDAVFGGVALLFGRHPDLKLILSHTAMTNPANARRLLETYPTLMLNLKMVRPGRSLHWAHLGPIGNAQDELYEDWAALMEALPGRFMIGTDARFGSPRYEGKRYRKAVERLRRGLGSLDPAAADAIAHGNARRVFGR